MSTGLHLAPPHSDYAAITVLLADGHTLMRHSLRDVLEANDWIELVGEATDIGSAYRQACVYHPDVLILDLRLTFPSQCEAIKDLRRDAPGTAIVVLTMETERAFAQRALGCGAIGYVLKDHAEMDLPLAIRCAAIGEQFVSPHVGEYPPLVSAAAERQLSGRSH